MNNEFQNQAAIQLDKKTDLAIALGAYLRASKAFQQASSEFTSACKDVRSLLGNEARFVMRSDYKYYIVTSDSDGNFDVNEIESL